MEGDDLVVGRCGRRPARLRRYLHRRVADSVAAADEADGRCAPLADVEPSYVPDASPEDGCRENRRAYEALVDGVCAGLRDALAELVEVEAAMARVALLFRVSQPGRPGRLTARWWKRRGAADWRDPTLTQVVRDATKRLPGGRLVPGKDWLKVVDRRAKAKMDGDWGLNGDMVELALSAWWPLVKRREELVGRIREARRLICRKERPDAGDWRYSLLAVEDGIEKAQGRVAEWRLSRGRAGGPGDGLEG